MAEGDPWADLPPSSYQADGEDVLFIPLREVGEDGALRVVPRVRPWQPGEKLDETGASADTFTLGALFNEDVKEPEFDQQVMWPDTLEALILQFKTGKTATLNLPWKRGLRVKPLTWQRKASADADRGGELLTVNFKTDNEDDLDREAFERVSVKATVSLAAQSVARTMEMDGMGIGDPIGGIIGLASQLNGLMNLPSDYANAIVTAAQRLRRAALILVGAYSTDEDGRNQMNGPEGASARLKLLELMELAANAEAEARASLPKTRTFIAQRNTSIWDIATELQQQARGLMTINPQIEDFSFIEKGTSVNVFAE